MMSLRISLVLSLLWAGSVGCGLTSPGTPAPSPAATDKPVEQASTQPTVATSTSPPSPTPTVEIPTPTPVVPQIISISNAANLVQMPGVEINLHLIHTLAWNAAGNFLAVSTGNDVLLFALDEMALEPVARLPQGSFTPALAFSPDSSWLATGSRDGMLRVWPVGIISTGASQASVPEPLWEVEAHQKGVNSVSFSPDGKWLASGGNDAVARIWEPASGEPSGMVIGGTFAVPSIAFSPDSKTLAIANGEFIRLRDPESESITGTLLSDTPVYTLEYSPDGGLLAAGDISNGVQVWDPALAFRTGQETYPTPLKMGGHSARPNSFRALVWDLAFNPDGSLLASAGGDNTVRIWDVATGSQLVALTGHTDAVTSLAFSPDSRLLASGGLDGRLLLWGIP